MPKYLISSLLDLKNVLSVLCHKLSYKIENSMYVYFIVSSTARSAKELM